MKARKVYEAIEFERGKDPYDVLEISLGRLKNQIQILRDDGFEDIQLVQRYPGIRDKNYDLKMLPPPPKEGKTVPIKTVLKDLGIGDDFFQLGKARMWGDHITVPIRPGRRKEFIKLFGIPESVDFERGKDPVKAMEVGMYDKLPRIVAGDYFWEGDNRSMGTDEVRKVLNNAFDPAEWDRDIGFSVKWPDGKEDYMFLQDIVNNPDIDYIAHDGEIFDVAMKVYESQDFERGLDAKDALRIGKKWQKVEPGDILKVYYDIESHPAAPDLSPGYVTVKATKESETDYDQDGDVIDRWFDGAIIDPKIPGQWGIRWDQERMEWVIEEN